MQIMFQSASAAVAMDLKNGSGLSLEKSRIGGRSINADRFSIWLILNARLSGLPACGEHESDVVS